MKTLLSAFTCLSLFITSAYCQTSRRSEAKQIVSESDEVHFSSDNSEIPSYVHFDEEIAIEKFDGWFKKTFQLDAHHSLIKYQETTDALGFDHYKFQQSYRGIPVHGAIYVVHSKDGIVTSMNGNYIKSFGRINTNRVISEKEGLTLALKHIDATQYRWEAVDDLQYESKFSSPPKGEKLIIETQPKQFRLAYKYDVYALKPLERAYVFIDAISGDVIKEEERIHNFTGNNPRVRKNKKEKPENIPNQVDAVGSAKTRYSGTQSITADQFSGGYRLRESGRNIQTYDMNTGLDYFSATDFISNDNTWDETANFDDAAYDAHWGAEVTYDYFLNTFGVNSYDNQGSPMLSYVHYSDAYNNAFWDGERMTYGDGSNSFGGFTPLTALDVVGHEFAHGITEFTADLIYAGESGALNEAFSDIFGTIIEFEGKPATANYELGEQISYDGGALRSLRDPNLYFNPDTYEGDYWDDLQGVHTNSGVGGHWFYLLTEGGSGTNDNSDSYSVNGIGMTKSADICYRTLSVYLTPTSNYALARFYSIKSAVDLYGPCTPEVESVTNAWYAVGVGDAYTPEVIADFSAGEVLYCSVPATVNFNNESVNSGSSVWDFGDNTSGSTDENPSHTYSDYGVYSVSLSVDGGTCGTDDTVNVAYITISSTATCNTKMPTSGTGAIQTACDGNIHDDGGASDEYSNSTNGSITIAPTNATAVVLNFTSFDMENGYDNLYIYDGPTTSSPIIGSYSGTSLPESGDPIYSTGGEITLQQSTDGSVTEAGFSANWTCLDATSGPLVGLDASPRSSCDGIVQFTDRTVNSPTSWFWDFGDGTTSTDQNPLKTYTASSTYNVKLKACNSVKCDSVTMNAFVTVNLAGTCDVIIPSTGAAPVQTACAGIVKDDGGDDDYTNGASGSVTISPTGATSVTLTFNSFDMESGYDYLYIYNGTSTSSPLIGFYTGTSLPSSVTSSVGSITVVQITDGSVTDSGFEFSWLCSTTTGGGGDSSVIIPASGIGLTQTECTGTLRDNGGSFNYSSSSDGSITISPTTGTNVTLVFSSFDMESDYDYLYIYDGATTSSPLLGRYSGSSLPNNGTVASTGGSITLRQTSDGSINYSGFECTWDCDGVIVVPTGITIPASGVGATQTTCTGTLRDSGGDDNYTSSSDGSITISPANAQYVSLQFSSFDFESGYDYLYIYDGPSTFSTLIGRFSGSSLPNGGTITSTGGSITLRQTSDGSINYDGFVCTWDCNGDIGTVDVTMPETGTGATQTECTGTLKDSGGNGNYTNYTDGTITISPTDAETISLQFSSFDFESGYDYLYIYDGPSTFSTLIGSYTGYSLPEGGAITSTGSSLTFRQYSDGSFTESGFIATWSCTVVDGVEDFLDASNILIYPNPTSDEVTIDLGDAHTGTVSVSMTNLLQETVLVDQLTAGNGTLNISSLSAGVYFIKIGNSTAVHRLIVQ